MQELPLPPKKHSYVKDFAMLLQYNVVSVTHAVVNVSIWGPRNSGKKLGPYR